MSSNWSRRDLMKFLGVGTFSGVIQSPMELLLESMVDGLVTQAVANETGKRARNYVFIQQHGAPSRWMYDLFINPNNDSKFVASKGVGSEFNQVGSVYDGVKYVGHKLKGGKYYGPRIWTQEVARAGGGNRRIDDLMNNMLVIQGVDTGNAGHSPSAELLNNPFTPVSLGGAVADKSDTPITSLTMGTSAQLYKSKLGKSQKNLSTGGNPLRTLMSPFSKKASNQMLNVEKSISNRLLASISSLNAYHGSTFSGSKSISIDQKNAVDLMATSVDDLGTKWTSLTAKYSDVVRRTIDMSASGLTGFSDMAIGLADVSARDSLIYQHGTNQVTNTDLREAILGAGVGALVERFAVAEYVLINQLSSSVGLGIGGTNSLKLAYNGAAASNSGVGHDQHTVGAMVSLLSNTLMYRALSACLLTLIDSLKNQPGFMGNTLFDDTVIRVASEFGRSAKADGSGADHASMSATNSIYSGSIKGLTITGDVTAAHRYNNNYVGSWGTAAKAQALGNRAINPGNVASSMSTLLGIEQISVNNTSLVSVDKEGNVNTLTGDSELVDA